MIQKNPYISILKLKGSLVDMSVVAINCAILGMWDYRAILVILAGVMIHSGCDIINDIFDREIDKICKPEGAIAASKISIKNAYLYADVIFSRTSYFPSIEHAFILMLTGRDNNRWNHVFSSFFPFKRYSRCCNA